MQPFGGLGLTLAIMDADSLADALIFVINDRKSETLLQKWSDARRAVFNTIVDPVASANKKRCHNVDPKSPFTDPFFRAIKEDAKEF